MTIVTIHQPQFLPWVHYFTKIKNSDIFISLDDVDFHKGGLQNRNYIFKLNSKLILTIPLINGHCKRINKIEICYNSPWQKKILKSIHQRYSKEPYFEEIFTSFSEIINTSPTLLADLNHQLIFWVLKRFDINTKVFLSSRIDCGGRSTEKLINLCCAVGGTNYVSGFGGKSYLNETSFPEQGLKLSYIDFSDKNFYTSLFLQNKNTFQNSIIDVLMKFSADEIWA